MSRFNLPDSENQFLDQLRTQLKTQGWIYKFLQVVVGAILPILEGIIVNKATDPENTAAIFYWILLLVTAIIHLFLLIALVSSDTPLPQFLIEFDDLKRDLENANESQFLLTESQAALEEYYSSLLSAIISTRLSLIGIENILRENTNDLEEIFSKILDPWIQSRTEIFSFSDGNAKYNFAIYLTQDQNNLMLCFRECDTRIVRKDRSWTKGVGHVGKCFALGETSFSDNATLDSTTTSERIARPEDQSYYKSVIAEPIKVNQDIVGVFIITSSKENQFQKDIHIPCVRAITRLLGIGYNLRSIRG